MQHIQTIEALEALYEAAIPMSLQKVVTKITPQYRRWIEASRFVVLSTVGPDGTDGSPRGDDGPVVAIADDKTLLMPDWRGNNRLDSLRNIVRDGRVSLMFMVPGSNNVVRVNGTAILTDDPVMVSQFKKSGKLPKTVIVITPTEVYFQCAKAILRSGLWTREDDSAGLPTAGDFIKQFQNDFNSHEYDSTYVERSKAKMW